MLSLKVNPEHEVEENVRQYTVDLWTHVLWKDGRKLCELIIYFLNPGGGSVQKKLFEIPMLRVSVMVKFKTV